MKLTITFDSLEEFNNYIIDVGSPSAPAPAQKAAEAPQRDETPKAKKNPKEAEKPQNEDVRQPEKAPEKTEVSEDFRVEVRKTLAQLNKKTGKNTASELIRSFGVEKLTDVELSDLPALMDKAKEALDAA